MPKKNGKNISFYMESKIVDCLHEYADEKGQPLAVTVERIVKEALDNNDKRKNEKSI